jgi:excisionase family DNA binding protein
MPVTADETAPVFAHHGERLLYKIRDAAVLLSLGESKVWELVARGDIESVKIDGARRIPRGAIEAYIEGLAARSGADAT